jgi:hypothetical protein
VRNLAVKKPAARAESRPNKAPAGTGAARKTDICFGAGGKGKCRQPFVFWPAPQAIDGFFLAWVEQRCKYWSTDQEENSPPD